ncbi:MAG: glycosyltransferase WbuB, partial [Alphaproteobacteria bacterium]
VAYTHYETDARVRREAESLAARGDEVDFICLKERRAGASERQCNGVRLYQIPVVRYRGQSSLRYILNYLVFFLQTSVLLSWLYLKRHYDVVQVHTMPDFMVFAAAIPRLCGARIVLDVHDLMPELYMCKFGLPADHAAIRCIRWVERQSIRFCHRALAVNLPHRDALVGHGNPRDKFEILLNVPDPRVFRNNGRAYPASDDRFRIVYHGTLSIRHGLAVAFHALADVREAMPRAQLLVIGEGDYRPQLVQLRDELGLGNLVRFSRGRIPLNKLPQLLAGADLGLVPMLNDAFTRYALPVKLLEYVELGLPVLVARTDTVTAYFDESVVRFFEPGSPEALARELLFLYENPRVRRALSQKARDFARRYNWAQQQKIYHAVMDALIAGSDLPATESSRLQTELVSGMSDALIDDTGPEVLRSGR